MEKIQMVILPMTKQNWQRSGVRQEGSSLFTTLSLAGAEVLEVIEKNGTLTLTEVISATKWPEPIVMMGVGVLIREGAISAKRHNEYVLLSKRY